NWALYYAVGQAEMLQVPLCVVFCLAPEYMGATWRQYHFMIAGLKEVGLELRSMGIGLTVLPGHPWVVLPPFLHEINASVLVTDFDPVRIKVDWKKKVVSGTNLSVREVDAHNIVPCWTVASRKIETFATFRMKIAPVLPEFLVEYPEMMKMSKVMDHRPVDWGEVAGTLRIDLSVGEVEWIRPGPTEGMKVLREFCENKLSDFPEQSVDPLKDGQSNLSPYLHFGQVSAQRVALEVGRSSASPEAKAKFLDNLIVKREIADNFCLHNPNYDTFGGFPEWAKRSIDEHRSDEREHIYTLEQLEASQTHDPLWNAAMMEMVKRGKMHGSLRPYWASKILEWSRTPEEAYQNALYINDRYGLDGRDASGYTGIAMVIGGLYDRPYRSKEVLGKVKRHTYTGQRMRFDVHGYCEMVKDLR
ncbi:MAG TPA: deoxyribodipyrimidine photo-lyase, partial [Methanomassiliicoccales archaeon]|nr:deoxyribodipyrimidine photo-lyase [Methanomassiliicoccales archaeon]